MKTNFLQKGEILSYLIRNLYSIILLSQTIIIKHLIVKSYYYACLSPLLIVHLNLQDDLSCFFNRLVRYINNWTAYFIYNFLKIVQLFIRSEEHTSELQSRSHLL